MGSLSAKALIGAGLKDEAWEVRAAAVEAARRMSLSEFVPELSSRLEDEIWWVRFRASEALVALGEPGINSLRCLAQSGRDRSRRMASLVMAERGVA
jgi:HEAT repeat protein